MSSLLDVPAQLAVVLSLAASAASYDQATFSVAGTSARPAQATFMVEPLEGPFRFSERNWLRALKEDVGKEAPRYAGRIFKTSGGRYYVPASEDRTEILSARHEPALAKRMAEAAARRNVRLLSAALQRPPTAGDLYIAHVAGPEAAADFIALAQSKPSMLAARQFPELAAILPTLAQGEGRPLTLADVYARLTAPLGAYEAGRPLPTRREAETHGTPPEMGRDGPYARTTFVSGAIDWSPQVSGPPTSASQ